MTLEEPFAFVDSDPEGGLHRREVIAVGIGDCVAQPLMRHKLDFHACMLTVEVERHHEPALDQAVVRLQHSELQEVRHLHAMHGVLHLHGLGLAVTLICARKSAIRVALKAHRGRRRVTSSSVSVGCASGRCHQVRLRHEAVLLIT